MIHQSIETIAKACNGVIINKGKSKYIDNISTDTRTIVEGSLYIPLTGENFDGHTFIKEALKKGAVAVLIQEDRISTVDTVEDICFIKVVDTLSALKKIGHYYRSLFQIPFIGVTGSVGKTTTKDLISGVLSSKYRVHKNMGNFNNQIGLPLTLFNLESEHEMSVLEMGMSSYGEILDLVNIVRPNIAVITNIGVSHIEYFGCKENIMKAKLEITANLNEGDYLLLNGDDDLLKNFDKKNKEYEVIFYGLSSNNEFYPTKIEDLGEDGSVFHVKLKDKEEIFKVKQPGLHNVSNALAAVWIGSNSGMTATDIQAGLSSFEPSKMRLEIINKEDIKIINDAYNASPDSMKAALGVLSNIKATRKIAVLGNIFEMGTFSEEGHRSVGKYFAEKEITMLITVGDMAKWIALEAIKNGLEPKMVFSVSTNEEAINRLSESIEKEDAILIKGSRGMKMEEIVRYLQERS